MSTMRSAASSSQIHDGFATIRSRGSLHRSRSSRASELLGVQQRASHNQLQQLLAKSSSASLGGEPSGHSHSGPPNGHRHHSLSSYQHGDGDGVDASARDQLYGSGFQPHRVYGGLHTSALGLTSPSSLLYYDHVDDADDVRAKRMSKSKSNSFKQSVSLDGSGVTDERTVTATMLTTTVPPATPPQATPAAAAIAHITQQQQPPLQSTPTVDREHEPQPPSYLYTRPVSPTYCNVTPRTRQHTHLRSATAYSVVFQPTYYRKDADPQQYALTKLAPPPVPPLSGRLERPRTLQCQPAAPVSLATLRMNAVNSAHGRAQSPTAYYSNDTNYYSPADILISAAALASSEQRTKTLRHRSMPVAAAALADKRYATLSYPRESQRLRQLSRSVSEKTRTEFGGAGLSTPSSPECGVGGGGGGGEYGDPLDSKIGCQTTLRSKPRIPWYELAIRKPAAADRRRQSCPPTYEVCAERHLSADAGVVLFARGGFGGE